MRWRALFLFGITSSLMAAGADDRLVMVAMRLSDVPNYSWTTSVVDDARTYEISGQTSKAGYTRVRTPVPNAIRRRLARSVTDSQIEAIFRGNVRCVIETDDGWKTVDELPRPDVTGPDVVLPPPPNTHLINKPPPPRRDEIEVAAYSNLQMAISHPHEELGVIVTSHGDLEINGDVIAGKLNDLGAQLLLVHDGQTEIEPRSATGTFKLWVSAGMVTRYQLVLDGVLAVTTAVGVREVRVHQTSDTSIRGVGTTRVEVPEQAKRKLGGA
jgi:hypothetical protein